MYDVSDDFIKQIGIAGKEKDTKIIIENKKVIPQTFKHSFSGNIFTSIMQKIEFEVKEGSVLVENTILKPKYGLKVNNEYEYINYSNYNVYSSEINYDTNIVKTVAYDNLIKFMIKYELEKLNIAFPVSILKLIQAICKYIGVQLYNTDFFNADLLIEEDLFTVLNCTYRDVIDYICQATLTTAIIKDNKLYFKSVKETNKTITPQILKKIKIKQQFGGCNSLVLGRGDLNDNIYSKDNTLIEQNGLQEIRFDNNEILNKRREEVVDNMFNQIKGLKYYSFETKDLGIGIFEPADFCDMQDLDENKYKVLILNQSISITSGCEGTMSSNVPEVSTTKYQYATDSQKRQTKTEIIVDKQKNKITQLAEETSKHEKKIAKVEQDINSINSTVSSQTETIEQVQDQTNLNTDEIAKLGSTATIEGEELKINASNNPSKIYIYGKTEQETSTTGKNKFQIGERTENTVGVTSIVDLSEMTFNGTTTSNGNLTVGHKSELSGYDYIGKFEAGTYYFSKFILGGSWTQNEEGSTFACYLRDANRTALCSIGGLTESGTNKKVVLEEETDLYIQIYCNGANTIFNNYKLGFQLEKDSATPYEKYIKTMPSTLFPSRIRNVGDNINIFDEELETGAISTTTGALTTNAQRQRSKNFIKVKNNTNYVMTVNNEFISLNRMFYDKDYNFISSTTNSSFRTPSTARYMKFYGASDLANAKIKIQEGTIATPCTPYNCGSADLKLVNDNLYNVNANNKRDDNTTVDKDGWITMINDNTEGTTVKNAQLYKVPSNDIKPSTDYYLVTEIKEISGQMNVFALTGATTSSNKSQFKTECQLNWDTLSNGQIIINKITTRDDFSDCVVFLRTLLQTNAGQSASITFRMSLFEDEITKDTFLYKEYKSQIVSFPLSEGQVLHENDYLAQDGIHQKRTTLLLDGTQTINSINTASNNTVRVVIDISNKLAVTGDNTVDFKCSHLPNRIVWNADKEGAYSATNAIVLRFNKDIVGTTKTQINAYLAEQYDNGIPVTIEYKLAEEEIIPYTPVQQEVLDSIETFKGINYIYCIDEIKPRKIIVTYYPNTPYNDTLINKDTFDKVTTEMNAEFNIKANEIESSVRESTTASILTLLNNGYLTAEQVNALVNGNAEDIAIVKEQLKQTITSSQMQIEITKAIEGGVSYLKNTLFTIDENGMAIATSEDEFNALYNNKGMYLYSYDEMIAKFDVNGATLKNLKVEGEIETEYLRMINVVVDGVPHTHIHWIGG